MKTSQMRLWVNIFFVLLALFSIPVSAAKAQGEQLTIIMEPLSQIFEGDSDILIRITIRNPSSKPITVPVWQVPANDIPTPILRIVSADGREVPYTGPLVKWSAEALQTGVTFAARSSRIFIIELSSLYDIGNGRFRIEYSQSGPGKYDVLGKSNKIFGTIAPVFIETRGRSKNVDGAIMPAPSEKSSSLTTTRCKSSQKSKLSSAISNAKIYAQNSNTYLSYNSNQSNTRYPTWFGAVTSDRWNSVKTHYSNIYSALATQTISIDCSCNDKSVYAYVYSNHPYRIYVCGAFWSAPATGTDSMAGTLIHEMSHFTIIAGTNDYAYGQSSAKSLASSDPSKAILNADNHEYFAENTPSLP